MRNLQRAKIDILFIVGKADTAHGKSGNAKDNEQNSNDRCSLHLFSFLYLHMIFCSQTLPRLNVLLWLDAVYHSQFANQCAY